MDALKTDKLADVIAMHIEKLIMEGALRPGEKLASERELAVTLEVSRPSLRDALEKLVKRGLLSSSRNGTYVAQFLAPMMKPLAQLYRDKDSAAADYFEFRQWLEADAARAAALRATNVDKMAIRGCLAAMRKVHRIEDPAQEAQEDVRLHMLVYEAGHNMIVLHMMRALSELLRNNIFYNRDNLYRRPGIREKLLTQHIAIGDAVVSGDADGAEAAATEHIRFVSGTVAAIQNDQARLGSSLRRAGRNAFLSE